MTFEAVPKTDHVVTSQSRLIEYFRDDADTDNLIASYVNRVQELEDAIWEVINERVWSASVGEQLTVLGKIVGIKTRTLNSDDDFRLVVTIQIKANRSHGLTEQIKSAAYLVLQDAHTVIVNGTFDATSAANSDGTIDLPRWIRVYRGSVASTIVGQFGRFVGTNVPRCYSEDGALFGLLGEPETTNKNTISTAELNLWIDNGATVDSAPDMSGFITNCRLTDDDAGNVENRAIQIAGLSINEHVASVWVYPEAPPTPTGGSELGISGLSSDDGDTTNVWQFLSVPFDNAPNPTTFFLAPRNNSVDTGKARYWGFQVEEPGGHYIPTTFIGWDGSTFTREVEVIKCDAKAFHKNGYINTPSLIALRLHYAYNDTPSDHNLVWYSANTRLYYEASGRRFIWRVNGVNLASSTVTFSKGQVVSITRTNHTDGTRSLTVSGCTTGNGTVTDNNASAILEKECYLLGDSSGVEFPADVTTINTGISYELPLFVFREEPPLQFRITLKPEIKLNASLVGTLLHRMRSAGVGFRFAYHTLDEPGFQLSDASSGTHYSEGLADAESGLYGAPLIAVVNSQLSYAFAKGFNLSGSGFDTGYDEGFD